MGANGRDRLEGYRPRILNLLKMIQVFEQSSFIKIRKNELDQAIEKCMKLVEQLPDPKENDEPRVLSVS